VDDINQPEPAVRPQAVPRAWQTPVLNRLGAGRTAAGFFVGSDGTFSDTIVS
jgi:hypothetical protein